MGKTWIMKLFGQQEYESVAYLNCDAEPHVQDVFALDYNIDLILLALQALTGVKVEPEKTLVILDEIQSVPRGLHSLKYFAENAPQYHVMAAGSLLGVTLMQGESFPVGKVDMMYLYPLSFEEYLYAVGHEDYVALLHQREWPLIHALKSKYIELLRQYYFVGGMPEVVSQFIKNKDISEVQRLQTAILNAYRNDISKHTSPTESIRIGQVFQSLPSQLAKENKKFIYGAVKKGARAKVFELAIQWLCDAGIVYKVNRVTKPSLPLKFYEDPNAFKMFLLDCGLLSCMAEVTADQMLGDKIFTDYKGAFTEQFVLQEFQSKGIRPFYWSKTNSPAEIDFLIQRDGEAVPVEVKAEEHVRSRSLSQFIKDNPNLKGLRFSMNDYIDQERMKNVPLYAISTVFQV